VRTQLTFGLCIAGICLVTPSALGAPGDPRPSGVRLEGRFNMRGTLTQVENVRGEHRGQHVERIWTFFPRCTFGACGRVTLRRRRSARRILDMVVLRRGARGLYVGMGRFWIALRCNGATVRHGGRATERITVRVTQTKLVGRTQLATGLRATYTNPSRENLTRCPGGIGHDAARYRGARAAPLPGPPTAAFTDTIDPLTATAAFTDRSQAGAGGPPIVSWSWNFGEPSSPDDAANERNPTHRYRFPGIYTVTLTIRDRYGQTATTTSRVTV
jgi:hypothetical protein